MKRLICLLLTLFMLVCTGVMAFGATVEKEKYTIELPENMYELDESRFTGDKNDDFSVIIEENTDETICVADMSADDAREYAEKIVNETLNGFKLIDKEGEMEVLCADVKKHPNGKKMLVTEYKATAFSNGVEKVQYQKICEFSGVDNKYSFVYIAEQESDLKDFDRYIDTITIGEAENKGLLGDLGSFAAAIGLFGIIILGIIRFLRTPAKRKAGKL